jgi:hypothetical protein
MREQSQTAEHVPVTSFYVNARAPQEINEETKELLTELAIPRYVDNPDLQ